VGWLGAVQSQEYALARWSVGMRMAGRGGAPAVESDVEAAIASGAILRTHILRLGVPSWLHGVFLDGQLVGWWRRTAAKGGYPVETRLLRDLTTREQSALQQAVERYSRFAERPRNGK